MQIPAQSGRVRSFSQDRDRHAHQSRRYVLLACAVALLFSAVVLVLAGYSWLPTLESPSLARTINVGSRQTVAPGKLHVLVTGAAGFIGSHASLALLEAGHTVTALDNLSRGNPGALWQLSLMFPAAKFQFLNVDLGDAPAVLAALQDSRPKVDVVMHFAALAYVGESVAEPLRYFKNVTVNTINLLDAMHQAGINKLVYSSSCAVYGNQQSLPITEQSVPAPNCPYGESKLFSEKIIQDFAVAQPRFQAILLRYFNVYGSDPLGRLGEYPREDLRQHARISGACLDAAMGILPHLTIKGTRHPTKDGTCVRDYVHVTDLIAAHMAAMEHTANPPALYNVGTGKGVSVKEFVEACKKVTGVDIKVIEQAEARPGDYAEVWADNTKIRREMGWSAKFINIEDGLSHAWAWRTRHPTGYGPASFAGT